MGGRCGPLRPTRVVLAADGTFYSSRKRLIAAFCSSRKRLIADRAERRGDPPSQIPPELRPDLRWPSGVDHERLDDPQQVFGEFVEVAVREADAGPVHVEAAEHGARAFHGDVGGEDRKSV